MEDSATYDCAYCGEENVIDVDISGGMHQDYYEDCQVCCRANRLVVAFDEESLHPSVQSYSEED